MQQLKQITLANIGDSSLQEIFDWVAFNLLKQGRRSTRAPIDEQGEIIIGVEDFCAYRGHGGDKCGWGFCITDEEYSQDMEDNSIGSLLLDRDIVESEESTLVQFATHLQRVHDDWPILGWKEAFQICAKDYKLNDKIVDLI